jgi:hypothetical protein
MKNGLKWTFAVLALGLCSQASALDLLSTNGTGAVGNCQAAMPAYEGNVRKRPLSLVNESEATSYVTCALTTEEVSLNVTGFSTRLSNISSQPRTVSCTAVVGDELEGASYIVKSITLAPHADGTLAWGTGDNNGLLFSKSVALSCALPPWVGLNRNRVTTLLSII